MTGSPAGIVAARVNTEIPNWQKGRSSPYALHKLGSAMATIADE
jgi:hypothetical protein